MTLGIRIVTLTACAVFLLGMLFGFAPGRGRVALRGLLTASIGFAVGAVIYFGWAVPNPSPWAASLGTMLVAAGCGLFLWALRSHPKRPGKAFANEAPTYLLTGGPYRLARHPLYVSYLLALGGTALLTHTWWVAGLTGWMACLYWYAARMEEGLILRSPRQAEYSAYMRRVNMFWPRWRGAPSDRDPKQSDVRVSG